MTKDLGGCDYDPTHKLGCGYDLYEPSENLEDYGLETYLYNYKEGYTRGALEAAIVAQDIKEKLGTDEECYDLAVLAYEDSFKNRFQGGRCICQLE